MPEKRITFDDLDGTAPPVIKDVIRMNGQMYKTWKFMLDGEKHSIEEIAQAVGGTHAAISARLRDFRKPEFGDHDCPKTPDPKRPGHYIYQLFPNPDVEVAEH